MIKFLKKLLYGKYTADPFKLTCRLIEEIVNYPSSWERRSGMVTLIKNTKHHTLYFARYFDDNGKLAAYSVTVYEMKCLTEVIGLETVYPNNRYFDFLTKMYPDELIDIIKKETETP